MSESPWARAQPVIADLPPLPPAGLPYRMGLNECAAPVPAPVCDAIVAAIADAHRYPDHECAELAGELAAAMGVPADHVVIGPGLVGMCRCVVHMTAQPGDEVVLPWPSFDDYLLDSVLYGAVPVRVPLRDHRIDVEAMVGAVTDRTRLLFIASPNNPTGTAVSREELEYLIAAVPAGVVVALDEAYAEFADHAAGPQLCRDHANVCVLRTFSKAYGLAGLRIGYAMVRPPLAAVLRGHLAPFGVSNLAQAAATAVLAQHDLYTERIASVVARRYELTNALRALDWPVVDSHANFVWLPIGADAGALGDYLASAGVSVRSYPGAGIRVTVGTAQENANFVRELARYPVPSLRGSRSD